MSRVPFAYQQNRSPCAFCQKVDYIHPQLGTHNDTVGMVFCSMSEETMFRWRRMYSLFKPSCDTTKRPHNQRNGK